MLGGTAVSHPTNFDFPLMYNTLPATNAYKERKSPCVTARDYLQHFFRCTLKDVLALESGPNLASCVASWGRF